MLKFKIYDNFTKHWCKDCCAGTHCFSNFVLSEDGEVLDFVGNYQTEFYSLNNQQEYLDLNVWFKTKDPVKSKKSRFMVFPWVGVRDNLGEEIYSGDIISVIFVEKEHILQVKYNYDMLAWEFTDDFRRFSWQDIKESVKIKRIGHYLDAKD